MIEKFQGYRVGQQFFASIVEAQISELAALIGDTQRCPADLAKHLIANKDLVLDVLTMTRKSLPKARKINGGTKKRKAPALGNLTPAAEPA